MSEVTEVATRARAAAAALAPLPRKAKDAALHAMADALVARTDEILAANSEDVDAGRGGGVSEALLDRLTLTPARVASMADGLRHVATLPDPVGEVVRGSSLPNGLQLRQVRVPLGVVGIVYEARPNVTADAAGLCVKSGNAVLLRGSASAYRSNTVLVHVLAEAATAAGLPVDSIQLVPGVDRESVRELMRARGLVDVLIPRGGAGLIEAVVRESQVPVIETGVGNCTVFVDASADLSKAVDIVLDAKTSRPSVCNAAETLLVHADVADEFLPLAVKALRDKGVTLHADERARAYDDTALPATDEDWAAEYLSLDLAVAVVDSLDDAVAHIRRWGSGHTEAIVTRDIDEANTFVRSVDSAAVMVNASTRFTDGSEFGFGAEIGISTQKLHARGPMGLPELTSTTYVVHGDGHVSAAEPVLTLDEAVELLAAARNAAGDAGVPMSFAVMDPAGHLLAFARMDGAPWISAEVAQGKAWTAAAYGMPSAAQKEKMAAMPSFATAITAMTHGRFAPQTGAVPVYRKGSLLGAIGASGGTGEQDEAACEAAVVASGFTTSG